MFKVDKVFVTPGAGRKTPLPIPGGPLVPAGGRVVPLNVAVQRLIRTGDLVVSQPATPAVADAPNNASVDVLSSATAQKVKG